MPSVKRICCEPGCGRVVQGASRCDEHDGMADRNHDQRRGSSTQRGYGARWQRLRMMVLNGEPLCRKCKAAATEVDHILPRDDGGDDSFENLQALCKSCHSEKTARDKVARRS